MKNRRIAAVLLFLLITITNISTVYAGNSRLSAARKLIVGMYAAEGFAMPSTDKNNNTYEGYAVDYLAQLGATCGYDIEIHLADRGMLLEDLILGKCDLILTDEEMVGEYSQYIRSKCGIAKEYSILYVPQGADVFYDEYDKFNGMKIGICRNSSCERELENYAAENGFTYKREYYESEERLITALKNGEVDAALLGSMTYINDAIKNAATFGGHDYTFVGSSDVSDVINAFDDAIGKYTRENNSYIDNIYSSFYWDSKANFPCLTRKEHDFVEAHPVVKVGYMDNIYPMQYTNEDGEFAGIVRGIFDFFSKYTGLNFTYYKYDSSDECRKDLLDGEIDLIAMVPYYTNWAQNNNIVLSSWYIKSPSYCVKASNNMEIKKVGITTSFSVDAYNIPDKSIQMINYDNIAFCLDAIKNEEIDAAYINGYSWMSYSDKTAYSMLKAEQNEKDLFFSAGSRVDNNEVNILKIINHAITGMSSELIRSKIIGELVFSEEKSGILSRFIVTYRIQLSMVVVVTFVGTITLIILNSRKKKEILEKLAYTDPVTGRANQPKFYIEAEKKLQYRDTKYAIGYVNIKNFKYINDFYGRDQGDIVLNVISHMLDDMMQPDGIYARFSADRFVFMVPYIDYETLKYNFENYIAEVEISISGYKETVTIKSTCGIYLVGDGDESVRDMVDKAAIAEKLAKDDSNNMSVVLYDKELNDQFVKNQEMTASMKKALDNEEFVVYLQPKVGIDTEKPVGCEALVRWISPEKGFIPVGDFVPLFEKNGFITNVDFYVLEQVCKMLRRRLDAGLPVFPVNVNQSRLHVNNRMYLSLLQDMLNKYDIPMNLVVFEITESAFIEDSQSMIALINKMKAMGFQFSMDDFGSGYSSFNLLKDMNVDELKIDREFLESTEDSTRSRYIIERIVQMAHGLDIRVVCEGVERKEQVEFLRDIECDIIQGYYYSKPMPMDEYEKYLLKFEIESQA